MEEYGEQKLSHLKQVLAAVLVIGAGVLLGGFLDPDKNWQAYLQPMLLGAGAVALSSIGGGYLSYPETVEHNRRYRPGLALLIGVGLGIGSGVTVVVLKDDWRFATLSSLVLALWLFVFTLGGTWVVRRVTQRGIAARDNRLSQSEGQTRSSYEARISHASRRARSGTKD